MAAETRDLWRDTIDHVYGDLSGQRALKLKETASDIGVAGDISGNDLTLESLIMGLQSYFVFVSGLTTLQAVHNGQTSYVHELLQTPPKKFNRRLADVASGVELTSKGVSGATNSFPFGWFADQLDQTGVDAAKELLSAAKGFQVEETLSGAGPDIMQYLFHRIMPRNLRHVVGEFYTPLWLAAQLVKDSKWEPGLRLIDPFSGSGVFLLAAVMEGQKLGASAVEVLPDLCAVDLNPVACAAVRGTLAIACREEIRTEKPGVSLQVLNADSLAPAFLKVPSTQADIWSKGDKTIQVDGEAINLDAHLGGDSLTPSASSVLAACGLVMPKWLGHEGTVGGAKNATSKQPSLRDRRVAEQLAVFALKPADIVATNPPWVGWEYMSRPYRSYLEPAWKAYDLFTAKGMDASFLKEDLSTLAIVIAWDHFLRDGGRCVAVLRSATMTSEHAARGVRRLSVFPDKDPMKLEEIRTFGSVRVFDSAQATATTWRLRKGAKTTFPVPVDAWTATKSRWRPSLSDTTDAVLKVFKRTKIAAAPIEPGNSQSRWLIGNPESLKNADRLAGGCQYRGRTGVFTGGANAVFYLEHIGKSRAKNARRYKNVVARSKRSAPEVEVDLEHGLVYEILRGRDLQRWRLVDHSYILCPHTAATKMNAIPLAEMRSRYPLTIKYLESMRGVLDARKGFAGWEKAIREESFYAIQRIGEYTFAPYKVAWKYIANDFVVTVIGPDAEGRPRFPNDKVMFVGLHDEQEAFFLCGVLSSDPFRWKVVSSMTGTQISTNAIAPLAVPNFNPKDKTHMVISNLCRDGHIASQQDNEKRAKEILIELSDVVGETFGLDTKAIQGFRKDLQERYGKKYL